MRTRTHPSDPLTFEEMLGLDDGEHCCPACGSRVVSWTLLAPREMECWEPECRAVWKGERD